MKYIHCFFLYLLISVSSCKVSNTPRGIYKYNNSGEFAKLEIDSSNTFKYYYTIGLMSISSEGKSWIYKDSLFLKSNEEPTWVNGRVIETIDSTRNYTLLKIVDDYTKVKIQEQLVIINGTDTVKTNKDGEIVFYEPIKTLFINYLDLYDFFYTVKNKFSNSLNIHLVSMSNSIKYFDKKRYLIKKRKLIGNKEIFTKQY